MSWEELNCYLGRNATHHTQRKKWSVILWQQMFASTIEKIKLVENLYSLLLHIIFKWLFIEGCYCYFAHIFYHLHKKIEVSKSFCVFEMNGVNTVSYTLELWIPLRERREGRAVATMVPSKVALRFQHRKS